MKRGRNYQQAGDYTGTQLKAGSDGRKYVKEVDAGERTVRFQQEIYDDRGALQEIHQKYPEDLGHQKVGR